MPVRISVVIPTYKSAAWVEATLESVVRQTYALDNLEIIVSDDRSPDDSVGVARRFLERHSVSSRVVVREKNGGAPANRNTGWRIANGEWIQFLDADDLLVPHKIALQAAVAFSASEDVGVVYSNWQYLSLIDGEWVPKGPLHAPFVDADPILQILEQPTFGYVGPALIRKSFLERVGGFDEKPNIGEDSDLMLRLAMAGAKFREARSEEVAFLYRETPGSLWRTYIKDPEAMGNFVRMFRTVELFLRAKDPQGQLPEDVRNALATRYSRFADFFVEHDPQTFADLKTWLKGLGLNDPLSPTSRMRTASKVLGFENAVHLRSALRKLRARRT